MTDASFESRLAAHCAPTLLGVKAASLFSLSEQEFPALQEELRRYNRSLCRAGLRFLILHRHAGRALILVYRPALLFSQLCAPDARALLAHYAYPPPRCLGALLRHLKGRFSSCGRFPHEIGLFLGYPTADVQAFIAGDAPCKLCGYWKVYCDVDAAKERFACYDACRACVCRMLAEGCTISQLLCAA